MIKEFFDTVGSFLGEACEHFFGFQWLYDRYVFDWIVDSTGGK